MEWRPPLPRPWNDDPPGSERLILQNLAEVMTTIGHDLSRPLPTIRIVQDWHRRIYDGVTLPVPYYAGEFRDSDSAFPELIGYEVIVGGRFGVPSADVPRQLGIFEAGIHAACARLDGVIPAGGIPGSESELHSVLQLAAIAHGEWIRIHPFANGNGRTARIWVAWVGHRYGLPLGFLAIKPRPAGTAYETAAYHSMRGNHAPMIALLRQELDEYMARHP